MLRALFSALEVWYSAFGARKAGNFSGFHQSPDSFSDLLLGHAIAESRLNPHCSYVEQVLEVPRWLVGAKNPSFSTVL